MYKVAKGTSDIVDKDYIKLDKLINIIKNEFILNEGKPLETPVFERQDVLLGKYGEEAETKLIYKLEDQGGEDLALRYDLTIPFVRYIKENSIHSMRRYAIGKVYRRDQPNVKSGRYREFYQADFDIYGEKMDSMMAEGLLLSIAANVLNKLNIKYKILINDITNLKFILQEHIKVPDDKFKKVCSIIDKLDKTSFKNLEKEFLETIPELDLTKLENLLLNKNPLAEESIKNYDNLKDIAEMYGYNDKLEYTNSLARGLDYYSGFIWEIKCDLSESSIIAGGRYDILLGKPLVGISFGVSRIMSLINLNEEEVEWEKKYFVTTVGDITIKDKMYVINKVKELSKIEVQDPSDNTNEKMITIEKAVLYNLTKNDPKLTKIINRCIEDKIRFLIIITEDEWNKNQEIIFKDLKLKTQSIMKI